LTDHIPFFLDEIIADLVLERDGPITVEHAKGSPPMHGVQRVEDGFNIAEVVAEYHLLRETLIDYALENGFVLDEETRRLIHRRIDEALALAVRAFAAHQANEVNRRRAEHLSFILHDLRTPLGAISLSMELLEADWPGEANDDAASVFALLRRNISRLSALVARVVEQSPLTEPGTAFTPELRQFDLWPLAERLLVDLRPVAEKERITLRNAVPRTLEAFADAGLVSQVIQNLLGNSFRFAPGGEVTISAGMSPDGEWVECEVSDTGAGIEPERFERIFELHETDPEPAKKSSGLGLAMVKQIVELHGGKVSVSSAPGAGATFRFSLPAQAPAAG
jgi:signal transduction histidine kinase